jgi:hypothetical protein
MKSTPASSRADLIAISVLVLPDGTPCITSKRLIVALPTPDFKARSFDDQRNMALAALI